VLNSPEQVRELSARLRDARWIALDTEADSLHAYPEKLCLIQISYEGADDLVDPLAQLDFTELLSILGTHRLILHGADYDLRLLRRTYNFVPSDVFDTMLAARLLGELQFGLNNLVERFLGVALEKGSQKADWARRPLTEKMEAYARNDTRYLKPLSDILERELSSKGRAAWHRETCARLIAECAVQTPSDPNKVWRIKGSNRLGRKGLAILRELWRWRETEALSANKPPFFILPHEMLIDLAAAASISKTWKSIVPRHVSTRRRKLLEEAVQKGLDVPASEFPEPIRQIFRRPSEVETKRFDRIREHRDKVAAELKLDPSLIASRTTLALLAQNWEAHQGELMSWQRELLGGNRE
jgi:ribonuclease D